MTNLRTDTEILTSKVDAMREDIRRLMPILSLLEPADRDQMSGFAERLLGFMQEIEEGYQDQTREFQALRNEFRSTNAQLILITRQLDTLLKGT